MRFSAHAAPVKKRPRGDLNGGAAAAQGNVTGRRGRASLSAADSRTDQFADAAVTQPFSATTSDNAILNKSAATIQRLFRGYKGRSWVLKLSHVVERVSKVVDIRDKFAPTRVRLQWLATHKEQLDWSDGETKRLFREEEERLLTVLAQLEEGGHVRLASNGESLTDMDMVLQGNPEFYSDYFLFKRNRLAHSTLIRSVTWLFWHVASGATADHDPDHLEFAAYRELFVRICKVLQPVFHLDTASAAALVDWQHDSQQFYLDLHGQSVMTGEAFHRSLFELVDTWTNVVDEEAYFNWLIALLWAITENSTVHNAHYDLQLRPLDDVRECLDIDGTLHVPPRFWDQRDHLVDIALGIQERQEFPGHVLECFDLPAAARDEPDSNPDPDEQPEGHEKLMRMLYERRALRHLQLMRRLKFKAAIVGHFTAPIEARSARSSRGPSVPSPESEDFIDEAVVCATATGGGGGGGATAAAASKAIEKEKEEGTDSHTEQRNADDAAEVAEALLVAEQESALAAAMQRRQRSKNSRRLVNGKTVLAPRQGGQVTLGQAMFGEGLTSSRAHAGNSFQVARRRTLVLKRALLLAELQRGTPATTSARPMQAEIVSRADDTGTHAAAAAGSEAFERGMEGDHAHRGSTAPTAMDASDDPLFADAIAVAQARRQLATQARQRRTEDEKRKRRNKPRRIVSLWPKGAPQAQHLPTVDGADSADWAKVDVKPRSVFGKRGHVAAAAKIGEGGSGSSKRNHRPLSPSASASNAQVSEHRVLKVGQTHSTNTETVRSVGASSHEAILRDPAAVAPKTAKNDLAPTSAVAVQHSPSDHSPTTNETKGSTAPSSSLLLLLRDPQSPQNAPTPPELRRRSPPPGAAEPVRASTSPVGSRPGRRIRSPRAKNSVGTTFADKTPSSAALQYAAAPLTRMGLGTASLAPPRYKPQGANGFSGGARLGVTGEEEEARHVHADFPAEPNLRTRQPKPPRLQESSRGAIGAHDAAFAQRLPVNTAFPGGKPRTVPEDANTSVTAAAAAAADGDAQSDARPSLQLEITSNKNNAGSAADGGHGQSNHHASSPTTVSRSDHREVQRQRARAGRLLVAATDIGLAAATGLGGEANAVKQLTEPPPSSEGAADTMHNDEQYDPSTSTRQAECNVRPGSLPLGAMPSASPASLKGSRNLRSQNFNANVLEHRRSVETAQVGFAPAPAIPSRHHHHSARPAAVRSKDALKLKKHKKKNHHVQSQKGKTKNGPCKPKRKTGSILPPLPPSQVRIAAAPSGQENVLQKLEALVDGSKAAAAASATPLPKLSSTRSPELPGPAFAGHFVFADNMESTDLPLLLGGSSSSSSSSSNHAAPETSKTKKSLARVASANNGRAMFGSAVASSSKPTNRRPRRHARKQLKHSKNNNHNHNHTQRANAALPGRVTTMPNALLPAISIQASAL